MTAALLAAFVFVVAPSLRRRRRRRALDSALADPMRRRTISHLQTLNERGAL